MARGEEGEEGLGRLRGGSRVTQGMARSPTAPFQDVQAESSEWYRINQRDSLLRLLPRSLLVPPAPEHTRRSTDDREALQHSHPAFPRPPAPPPCPLLLRPGNMTSRAATTQKTLGRARRGSVAAEEDDQSCRSRARTARRTRRRAKLPNLLPSRRSLPPVRTPTTVGDASPRFRTTPSCRTNSRAVHHRFHYNSYPSTPSRYDFSPGTVDRSSSATSSSSSDSSSGPVRWGRRCNVDGRRSILASFPFSRFLVLFLTRQCCFHAFSSASPPQPLSPSPLLSRGPTPRRLLSSPTVLSRELRCRLSIKTVRFFSFLLLLRLAATQY